MLAAIHRNVAEVLFVESPIEVSKGAQRGAVPPAAPATGGPNFVQVRGWLEVTDVKGEAPWLVAKSAAAAGRTSETARNSLAGIKSMATGIGRRSGLAKTAAPPSRQPRRQGMRPTDAGARRSSAVRENSLSKLPTFERIAAAKKEAPPKRSSPSPKKAAPLQVAAKALVPKKTLALKNPVAKAPVAKAPVANAPVAKAAVAKKEAASSPAKALPVKEAPVRESPNVTGAATKQEAGSPPTKKAAAKPAAKAPTKAIAKDPPGASATSSSMRSGASISAVKKAAVRELRRRRAEPKTSMRSTSSRTASSRTGPAKRPSKRSHSHPLASWSTSTLRSFKLPSRGEDGSPLGAKSPGKAASQGSRSPTRPASSQPRKKAVSARRPSKAVAKRSSGSAGSGHQQGPATAAKAPRGSLKTAAAANTPPPVTAAPGPDSPHAGTPRFSGGGPPADAAATPAQLASERESQHFAAGTSGAGSAAAAPTGTQNGATLGGSSARTRATPPGVAAPPPGGGVPLTEQEARDRQVEALLLAVENARAERPVREVIPAGAFLSPYARRRLFGAAAAALSPARTRSSAAEELVQQLRSEVQALSKRLDERSRVTDEYIRGFARRAASLETRVRRPPGLRSTETPRRSVTAATCETLWRDCCCPPSRAQPLHSFESLSRSSDAV